MNAKLVIWKDKECAKMLQEQNELLSKNCELILSHINDLYNMGENDDRNS